MTLEAMNMAYEQKVDFHAHFLSDTYYEYLDKYEGPTPDSFPTPEWSVDGQLKLMQKLGIAFAFLSVSSPNMSRADRDDEIKYVRKINEEGAQIVKSHPEKFGLMPRSRCRTRTPQPKKQNSHLMSSARTDSGFRPTTREFISATADMTRSWSCSTNAAQL